jgi:hypothetical protein
MGKLKPMDKDVANSSADYDRVVRTVCSPNCAAMRGVLAFVKNDRIVKLEPASFPDPGRRAEIFFQTMEMRGLGPSTGSS